MKMDRAGGEAMAMRRSAREKSRPSYDWIVLLPGVAGARSTTWLYRRR